MHKTYKLNEEKLDNESIKDKKSKVILSEDEFFIQPNSATLNSPVKLDENTFINTFMTSMFLVKNDDIDFDELEKNQKDQPKYQTLYNENKLLSRKYNSSKY